MPRVVKPISGVDLEPERRPPPQPQQQQPRVGSSARHNRYSGEGVDPNGGQLEKIDLTSNFYRLVKRSFDGNRKELNHVLIRVWARKYFYRQFKFVDQEDLFYFNDLAMDPDERFKMFFGFDYTLCSAPPQYADGTNPTLLIGISTRLYLMNALCTDFVDVQSLSMRSRRIYQKKIAVPGELCFQRLQRYMEVAAKGVTRYGLHIDPDPIHTYGKLLRPPPLLPPRPGMPFYRPGSIEQMPWMIVCFNPDVSEPQLEAIAVQIKQSALDRGMRLGQQKVCRTYFIESAQDIDLVFSELEENGIKLALVLIAEDHGTMRTNDVETVIQYSCTTHGIKSMTFGCSQFMMKSGSLHGGDQDDVGQRSSDEECADIDSATMNELLFKMCRMAGGAANILEPQYMGSLFKANSLHLDSTMIVCRYHRKDGGTTLSSGFWSSLDGNFIAPYVSFSYVSSGIIRCAMEKYYEHNGYYPKFIFLFHNHYHYDALNATSLNKVIDCIRSDVHQMNGDTKLVYLFVVKQARESFIRSENQTDPKMGTFVDNFVKNPDYRCFYIYSGASDGNIADAHIRPTKYLIGLDQVGLSIDFLGEFCFALCHYYFKSFGVHDIPVPLEYANEMAKCFEKIPKAENMLGKPVGSTVVVNVAT